MSGYSFQQNNNGEKKSTEPLDFPELLLGMMLKFLVEILKGLA